MTPAQLRAGVLEAGLALPEAWEDFPWGESVVKVRKKVFVFLGVGGGETFSLTVKLPVSGPDVIARYADAAPSGYGLGKSGWVTIRIHPEEPVQLPELVLLVEESYRAVAPKTLARQVLL